MAVTFDTHSHFVTVPIPSCPFWLSPHVYNVPLTIAVELTPPNDIDCNVPLNLLMSFTAVGYSQ